MAEVPLNGWTGIVVVIMGIVILALILDAILENFRACCCCCCHSNRQGRGGEEETKDAEAGNEGGGDDVEMRYVNPMERSTRGMARFSSNSSFQLLEENPYKDTRFTGQSAP